jgi:hypothetical protein
MVAPGNFWLHDSFVVPIPTTLKVTGFFRAAGNTTISADAREDVARRLADAQSGWNVRLHQARQQLPAYCDRPVFGRTELNDGLPALEFGPSGVGEIAGLPTTVDLRPMASSMNRLR